MAEPTYNTVDLPTTTRYGETLLLSRDGVPHWGLWKITPFVLIEDDFQYHQIKAFEIGRLDLIAHRYYGVSEYWWYIAHANDIIDPIRDMRAGKFLKIPRRQIIDAYIQRITA